MSPTLLGVTNEVRAMIVEKLAAGWSLDETYPVTARRRGIPYPSFCQVADDHGYPDREALAAALVKLRALAAADLAASRSTTAHIKAQLVEDQAVEVERFAPPEIEDDVIEVEILDDVDEEAVPPPPTGRSIEIPLAKLLPHPTNPRDETVDIEGLAASIQSVGLLQALVVMDAPDRAGFYVVLAGHRRLEAVQLLGWDTVACVVRADTDDVDKQLVVMLVENLQRSDLGPVEKAEAFKRLRDAGLTLEVISTKVGVSRSLISHYLTLLDLAPESLQDVRDGKIPVTRALNAVRDSRSQQRRARGGSPTLGAKILEPAWFTARHQLADAWRARCNHTSRPRRAGGCDQCIEAVIRADEREHPTADETAAPWAVEQPRVTAVHGTPSGYAAHFRTWHTDPCDECKAAKAALGREQRSAEATR